MVTYIFKYLIFMDDKSGAYLDLLLGEGGDLNFFFNSGSKIYM
jgi:hypothetical protein